MIIERKESYGVRVYRRASGKQEWVGSFRFKDYGGKRAAKDAAKEAERQAYIIHRARDNRPSVAEYVQSYLDHYESRHKRSSHETTRQRLQFLVDDFGPRDLNSITRTEAKAWAATTKKYAIPAAISLFNSAMDEELIDRNPFRGLSHKSKGRAHMAPPTSSEHRRLDVACDALKDYAPKMRALFRFASYTGMRPGELFALRWDWIDFENNRVRVLAGVYHGVEQLPKSNKTRTIVLTPPAREAVLTLERESEYVFTNKRGGRLSASSLSGYWGLVLTKAGLDFDFYLATKHFCVHFLYTVMELPPYAIGQQMGWTEAAVNELLKVYGHGSLKGLERIDQAFAIGEMTAEAVTSE